VEEQAGFRRERSTVDQIFTMNELIKNRRPNPVYGCFIDIQKAYDRVWRGGLWERLHEYGLRGKMWRVLRGIYERVESSVLVNDAQTRLFNIEVGLRQGCLLSPILFALYINSLGEEIKRAKIGVKLARSEDTVGCLLFADDIALLAEKDEDLKKLMDITYKHSQKWRYSFNYDKCAVVVFNTNDNKQEIKYGQCGQICTCGKHWKLGDQWIKEVRSYKYLGAELDDGLSFNEFKTRILEKARSNMSRIWGMGMYNGCLSVKASINLYESLVRSILEYGAEVWGDEVWEEGERVQREMGRRILRCHGKTTNAAVIGEMGWWKLRTRRDFMKLKYWIKILLMDDSRLVKRVYRASKKAYMDQGTRNWCQVIHKLVIKYKLEDLWKDESAVLRPAELEDAPDRNTPRIRRHWFRWIYKRMHEVEQEEWLKEINSKAKLRTYRTFKTKLELEPYLLSENNKPGRYLLTSIRTGTNKLRIETGRWKRPREEESERVCRSCNSGEVEDEKHFVLNCTAYKDLRATLLTEIMGDTQGRYHLSVLSPDDRWTALMKRQSNRSDQWAINKALKAYIRKAMKLRNG
jgi:hypothetical protein